MLMYFYIYVCLIRSFSSDLNEVIQDIAGPEASHN